MNAIIVFALFIIPTFTQATPEIVSESKQSTRNNFHFLFFMHGDSVLVGTTYFGGDGQEHIFFWSFPEQERSFIVDLRKNEWVEHIAKNCDDDRIVISTYCLDRNRMSPYLGCYSLSQRKWIWKVYAFHQQEIYVEKISFSDEGKKVLVLDRTQIYTLDAETGKIIRNNEALRNEYPVRNKVDTHAFFSPKGKYCCIWQTFIRESPLFDWLHSEGNQELALWDMEKNQMVLKMTNSNIGTAAAWFSNSEDSLFLSHFDGSVSVWFIPNGKKVFEWKVGTSGLWYLFSDKGGRFIGTYSLERVKIWNYPYVAPVMEFQDIIDMTSHIWEDNSPMCLSDDGKFFAIEKLGVLYLYETTSWKEIWCKRIG
jgi:WD40 repeat protein